MKFLFIVFLTFVVSLGLVGCGSGYSSFQIGSHEAWGSPDELLVVKNNIQGTRLQNFRIDGVAVRQDLVLAFGDEVQLGLYAYGRDGNRVLVKADVCDVDGNYLGVAARSFRVGSIYGRRRSYQDLSDIWIIDRFEEPSVLKTLKR